MCFSRTLPLFLLPPTLIRLSPTLAALFIDSSIPAAYVWGAHEIIATIAQMYLHPSILPTICDILDFSSDDPTTQTQSCLYTLLDGTEVGIRIGFFGVVDKRTSIPYRLWDGLLIAKAIRTVPQNYSRPTRTWSTHSGGRSTTRPSAVVGGRISEMDRPSPGMVLLP